MACARGLGECGAISLTLSTGLMAMVHVQNKFYHLYAERVATNVIFRKEIIPKFFEGFVTIKGGGGRIGFHEDGFVVL